MPLQGPASSYPEDPGPSQVEWEDTEGESSAQSAQTQQPTPEQATSTGTHSLCMACAACCQLIQHVDIDQSLCSVYCSDSARQL